MDEFWRLRLYVNGRSGRSRSVCENLQNTLNRLLSNSFLLEVVDVTEQPEVLERDDVIALPMVVRIVPDPAIRIVGELAEGSTLFQRLGA